MDKTLIIAEIGSCHDGSFNNAKQLIKAAAETGADAVKFQTHISEAETLKDAPMPPFFKGEPRYEYFERTGFTKEQWTELKRYCDECGVSFISSAFSEEAVDLLEEVGTEYHKVPSGEVTNLPMLVRMAKTGKTVLLSSGMSNWEELTEAIETLKEHTDKILVFQCTTAYPTDYKRVGLNVMDEIKERFDVDVGLSDHTLTNYSSFAAVMKGAKVIEKHFTLSRGLYGSDAKHSLEPDEFKDLVDGIRAIELMLHHEVDKNDLAEYEEMKTVFQKSIVTTAPIKKGERITRDMIAIKKPGTGIPPKHIDTVVGMKAKEDIDEHSVLKHSHVGLEK